MNDIETSPTAVAGYYPWPPLWVGSEPTSIQDVVPAGSLGELTGFGEVVMSRELPCGVTMHSHRDGLFLFDLDKWASSPTGGEGPPDFDAITDAVIRRVALMNSHLAALLSAVAEVSHLSLEAHSVTHRDLLYAPALDAENVSMGGPLASAQFLARFRATYASGAPPLFDWRNATRVTVEVEAVERSADTLNDLLALDTHGEEILRLQLLLKAAALYCQHNYSESLAASWTVAEGELFSIWREHLEQRRKDADGGTLINAERMKQLLGGRDITASTVTEFASLLGLIDLDRYRALGAARTARNKWLHEMRVIDAEAAVAALRVAERMFGERTGIDLELPAVRSVSG